MNSPAMNDVAMPIKPKSDHASTAEAGKTTSRIGWNSRCGGRMVWGSISIGGASGLAGASRGGTGPPGEAAWRLRARARGRDTGSVSIAEAEKGGVAGKARFEVPISWIGFDRGPWGWLGLFGRIRRAGEALKKLGLDPQVLGPEIDQFGGNAPPRLRRGRPAPVGFGGAPGPPRPDIMPTGAGLRFARCRDSGAGTTQLGLAPGT